MLTIGAVLSVRAMLAGGYNGVSAVLAQRLRGDQRVGTVLTIGAMLAVRAMLAGCDNGVGAC